MESNLQGGTFNHDVGMGGSRSGSGSEGLGQSLSDKAGDALSSVRDAASSLPGKIADTLESGADALHSSSTPPGAIAGDQGAVLANDSHVAQAKESLAKGMQSSADWLRNTDLNKLRDGVEQQVKEQPGRTLLIALAVGYVLGKAIRS